MIHPITKYGEPVLEQPTKRVENFDQNLAKLIEDMFESMYAANGVLPRDRSLERQSLPDPPEHAQARSDQAQNP